MIIIDDIVYFAVEVLSPSHIFVASPPSAVVDIFTDHTPYQNIKSC